MHLYSGEIVVVMVSPLRRRLNHYSDFSYSCCDYVCSSFRLAETNELNKSWMVILQIVSSATDWPIYYHVIVSLRLFEKRTTREKS